MPSWSLRRCHAKDSDHQALRSYSPGELYISTNVCDGVTRSCAHIFLQENAATDFWGLVRETTGARSTLPAHSAWIHRSWICHYVQGPKLASQIFWSSCVTHNFILWDLCVYHLKLASWLESWGWVLWADKFIKYVNASTFTKVFPITLLHLFVCPSVCRCSSWKFKTEILIYLKKWAPV